MVFGFVVIAFVAFWTLDCFCRQPERVEGLIITPYGKNPVRGAAIIEGKTFDLGKKLY